ncbi:MAG: PLP-dependent transferase [Anaerobutyricum sp.]
MEKIFENKAPGFCYTRVANPTVTAFENRITKLEGGITSVACASGMAALTNAFLNILQSGDEIVSSAGLYGGSIDHVPRSGNFWNYNKNGPMAFVAKLRNGIFRNTGHAFLLSMHI